MPGEPTRRRCRQPDLAPAGLRPAEPRLFLPNPNYSGDPKRPWSAIAFRFGYQPGEAIRGSEAGLADAATSGAFEPLLNAASERAKTWGPAARPPAPATSAGSAAPASIPSSSR